MLSASFPSPDELDRDIQVMGQDSLADSFAIAQRALAQKKTASEFGTNDGILSIVQSDRITTITYSPPVTLQSGFQAHSRLTFLISG